jgi:carbamoyltransferase
LSVVLGINAYHADSAACVVVDGQLVAAAEEERFRRIKHWAGFPSLSIQYCLREAGISIADVEHVAVNSDPKANLLKKAGFALRQRPELSLLLQRLSAARERRSIADEIRANVGGGAFAGAVHGVEHHLAHLASCFFVSPFDEAVAVSVDGFGDFASAAWGLGRGGRLEVDERVYFPHSLGIFYQALTQFIGFHGYGDEYKVMGLAPYGEPRYADAMRQIVGLEDDGSFRLDLRYFRHHREKIDYEWSGGSPKIGILYAPELEQLLGPARAPDAELTQRYKDIARSVQAMYEDAFFHLLNRLHDRYRTPCVAIAGGCGMNSVANGKIALRTPFRRVYVQAAAGDAGGAIGAALVVAREVASTQPRGHMAHAYWGPASSDAEIAALLDTRRQEIAAAGCSVRRIDDDAELCAIVADEIAAGRVIGWFQGRMEWGPRALGNRSILGDPRRGDMKDILNLKIKRRESFRPFAPSVLREAVSDWFEQDDDVPFMMQVFQIKEPRRAQIPAVTHVDGSGRLQTVSAATNPLYHKLISAFRERTGVPMVLNTSFNENEPVVCRPEEALDCFLRTKMDVLALEHWLLVRGAAK